MNRRDKRLAAMEKARELPYSLSTSLVYDELPGVPKDRGRGRVLLQAMQVAQGNFDHMQSQIEAFRRSHDEHGKVTNHLKDKLSPHDHPRMDRAVAPGTGWYSIANQLVGGIDEQPLFATGAHFVPTYISEACTIQRVSLWIIDDSATLANLRIAIYAGDNEGNYPGSLLTDDVLIDYFGAGSGSENYWYGFPEGDQDNVEVGPGWYWFGAQQEGAGDDIDVDCSDAMGGYEGILQGGQYDYDFSTQWPFPDIDSAGEQTGTMGLYMDSWVADDRAPAWAGDITSDFQLSQYANGLGFMVV